MFATPSPDPTIPDLRADRETGVVAQRVLQYLNQQIPALATQEIYSSYLGTWAVSVAFSSPSFPAATLLLLPTHTNLCLFHSGMQLLQLLLLPTCPALSTSTGMRYSLVCSPLLSSDKDSTSSLVLGVLTPSLYLGGACTASCSYTEP